MNADETIKKLSDDAAAAAEQARMDRVLTRGALDILGKTKKYCESNNLSVAHGAAIVARALGIFASFFDADNRTQTFVALVDIAAEGAGVELHSHIVKSKED